MNSIYKPKDKNVIKLQKYLSKIEKETIKEKTNGKRNIRQ